MGEFQEGIDYFSKKSIKPKSQWNELDFLCDSMQKAYGIEIIYEYTPRIIGTSTFFFPPQYDKALPYTKIMLDQIWLKPLKNNFPEFFERETPIEFILSGSFIHFNTFTNTGATVGAGLNGQYYRLGMGGVNAFSKTDKNWLYKHITTLYHEHAHQIDHKYGRGQLFDQVSSGRYYGLNGYDKVSLQQAQKDGFMEGYGGYAPEEDFATNVEYMARFTEAQIKAIIMVSKSSDLETKNRMVYNMYKNLGMDLHKLNRVLDSAVYRVNY